MVRCFLCDTEVIGKGHIQGIRPGSDSLKLGLCPEHDNIENRALVREKWNELMLEAASRSMRPKQAPTPVVTGHEITVRYLDGGVKTVSCDGYQVNNENELLVAAVGKEYQFYPLQHVRSFTVRNVLVQDEIGDTETQEPSHGKREGASASDVPRQSKSTVLETMPPQETGPARRRAERRKDTAQQETRTRSHSLQSMETLEQEK